LMLLLNQFELLIALGTTVSKQHKETIHSEVDIKIESKRFFIRTEKFHCYQRKLRHSSASKFSSINNHLDWYPRSVTAQTMKNWGNFEFNVDSWDTPLWINKRR
jgi:hypothetical protein